MLRVGANLVQIYTGFVYEGPLLPRTIARGLLRQMKAEGAATLADITRAGSPHVNGAARAFA
jgi:dihydroorotate dehydrogenase